MLKAGATPAQVIDASGVIEDAGFTIIDDLLHGYGGGYLPPILGCKSRPAGPVPEEPFRAGQTVVIQPNVVTRDRKAGVQTGEMVLITRRTRHRAAFARTMPRGFADSSSELLRHPVRALRAPAIGAVVGDVVAVLDHHQFDRALDLARQPLGVGRRHDAVVPAVDDEDRTGDVLRDAVQRQRRGVLAAPRRRVLAWLRTRNASRVSSGRPSQAAPQSNGPPSAMQALMRLSNAAARGA